MSDRRGDIAASIDLGSNTLRLLIARLNDQGRLEPVHLERRITRLSQNLTPGRPLHAPARERAMTALREFGKIVEDYGVKQVFGGATAAARTASDGAAFLARVEAETGLPIRVIAPEEEARITALGIAGDLDNTPGEVVTIDPGGASTELVPVIVTDRGEKIIKPGISLHLGVVVLTETYLRHDPPTPAEMEAVERETVAKLERAKAHVGRYLDLERPPRLVGTAGTVTTIAALLLKMADYDAEKITGYTFTSSQLGELKAELAARTSAQRLAMPGLEPGREDVILPGVIIVEKMIEVFGGETMTTVDASLLEGLLIDGLS